LGEGRPLAAVPWRRGEGRSNRTSPGTPPLRCRPCQRRGAGQCPAACDWLSVTMPTKEYLIGLGEMYVADPRFGATYDRHGEGTAEFIRDALKVYADGT
jgi:hypothetical protein